MKMPTKEELKGELEKLRDVSSKNELLTKQISQGQSPALDVQGKIQEYIKEQSRIVDKFVSLSQDKGLIEKFQEIVKQIEKDTSELEASTNKEEIGSLKEKILNGINSWIGCLEEIIVGVIKGAPG